MANRTLDLRKVFGMIVSFDKEQPVVLPDKAFAVLTEFYPGGESAVHLHPNQEETYAVREEEMQVLLNGNWQTLRNGETVIILKGAVHAFRNTSGQKVIALNTHNPGLRFGEMLQTINQHLEAGKITSTKGLKNLFYMAGIMVKYNDVMVTVKPPNVLIKFMAVYGGYWGTANRVNSGLAVLK
ncbi:MAG: Cupin domain protein [Adhaeribacter sp.]|nr:Cupin domain protein [Adhaeribacter sp.]